MKKHTKGPWEIIYWEDDPSGCTVGHQGQSIAGQLIFYRDDAESMANAKLISAAPMLLEACEIALKRFGDVENHQAVRILREAIATATSGNGKNLNPTLQTGVEDA